MRLSIAPDEGSTTRCDCCGKTSHTAYGYVDDEDENVACGFYLTAYTEQHAPDLGTMIISLGDWSQNKSDDRVADRIVAEDPRIRPWYTH